jgi:hypothetical protein
MKNYDYLPGTCLYAILLAALFPAVLSAQQMPADGMDVRPHNFTSFVTVPQENTSEWRRFNEPDDYDHPEFGRLPKDAPCQSCVEVLSKRAADERYFVNTNNPSEFYQQKSLGDCMRR